jgi:5'-deoxynucleotidase YfbR-like HD superfamily hydrolase
VNLPKYQKSTGKTTKAVTKLDKLTKIAKSSNGYQKRNAETDAVAELLGGLYN